MHISFLLRIISVALIVSCNSASEKNIKKEVDTFFSNSKFNIESRVKIKNKDVVQVTISSKGDIHHQLLHDNAKIEFMSTLVYLMDEDFAPYDTVKFSMISEDDSIVHIYRFSIKDREFNNILFNNNPKYIEIVKFLIRNVDPLAYHEFDAATGNMYELFHMDRQDNFFNFIKTYALDCNLNSDSLELSTLMLYSMGDFVVYMKDEDNKRTIDSLLLMCGHKPDQLDAMSALRYAGID